MPMNLVRVGGAGILGIAAGITAPTGPAKLAPVNLGGNMVGVDTLVSAGALLLGGALQWFSPFTLPNLVDGVVDGSAAILLQKGTIYVGKGVHTGPWVSGAPQTAQMGYAAPYALPSYGGGRAQLGSVAGLNRMQIV